MCEEKCNTIKKHLPENPTTEQIRYYFLIYHNETTQRNSPSGTFHMAIPYFSKNGKIAKPFYDIPKELKSVNINPIILSESERLGIILPKKLEEIIITHIGVPVDTLSFQELKKYTSQILR